MIPIIGPLIEIGNSIIGGIKDHFEARRKIKEAVTENKIRMALSEQSHNQTWEMKQIENSGWKDDVLFYAWIAFFAWTAYDPEQARIVFENWKILPEWFLNVSGWIIGSVLGVKKLGDYLPPLIGGVKEVLKKKE